MGADLNPLGKIATKQSQNPSMGEYIEELVRLDYIQVIQFFKRFCKLQNISNCIDKSFLPLKFKEAYKKLINKRYQEFLKAYENFGI